MIDSDRHVDDPEARHTMTDQEMNLEPSVESTPQRPRLGRLAAVGAGIVLVVMVASAAGAVIGHELWTTSSRAAAPAPVLTPNPAGSGFFGGSGRSSTGTGPSNAAAIAAKVDPAVVNIDSSNTYQGSIGAGTGIVISSDGRVLTNNHVIRGATRISVTDVGDGKTYDAKVIGYDPSHDVAVLQLQGASGLATAKLGDSSKLSVGDGIVGVGNAGGTGSTPSYAGGSVTGLGRSITATDESGGSSEKLSNLIEVNANIQPGDSGGPLVNANGQVVGMITAGSGSFSGFDFGSASGAAYAIPIDDASKLAVQMISGHGPSTTHIGDTAFLGITISAGGSGLGGFFGGGVSAPTSGVGVGNVLPNEPAQKAGLAPGDTITAIDGRTVGSAAALGSLMLGHHPGDHVKVAWTDTSGASHTASVTLGSGPPA
jgi:S1-C subfamily serine protease